MLRNDGACPSARPDCNVLNEVLSLNAQESGSMLRHASFHCSLLNEVLSLNAQELLFLQPERVFGRSSMKS